MTGAREALPDTGRQPIAQPIVPSAADAWGARGSGRSPQAGSPAYPEQWYDNPRLDDRVLDDVRHDQPRPGGSRLSGPPAGSRPTDPRLEGMNYGELRYDDPAPMDPAAPGQPGYDEPLDDESWYEELRRSAPAYPQGFGPQHRAAPIAGWSPRRPTTASSPVSRRRRTGRPGTASPAAIGRPPPAGAPEPCDERRADDRPRAAGPQRPGSPFPRLRRSRRIRPRPGTGFRSAPAAPVGLLTPPAGTRVDALHEARLRLSRGHSRPPADSAAVQVLTAPTPAVREYADAVRPGHGLDGRRSRPPGRPSLRPTTSSRSRTSGGTTKTRSTRACSATGAPSSTARTRGRRARAGPATTKRRTGRRRGRSNDHRLWLGLGGVVIVAAAAITGIIKFEFPSHSGPAHAMVTPAKIGTYVRTVDLEKQVGLSELRDDVIKMSSGQASDVKSAVYESGNSAAGNTEQIIMFIGGHLANADPAASITGFTQKFPGAHVASAGSMGGKAACVQDGTTTSNSRSLCVWFDNDSFGEIVSPTMNATALANAMRTVRPSVELVAKK